MKTYERVFQHLRIRMSLNAFSIANAQLELEKMAKEQKCKKQTSSNS